MQKRQANGFSIAELVVAVAILGLLAGGVAASLSVFVNHATSSGTKLRATQLAEEGQEATRNIRDNAYANLTDGTFGVQTSGSQWQLSGVSDTNGIFTRQIQISNEASNQKRVVSTVSWPERGRTRSVSLTSFLTNWRAATASGGGLIFYGDGTTLPKYRTYDQPSNVFSSEQNTVSGTLVRTVVVRASPTKRELVAGYVSSTGVMQILCFDGSSWSNEWSATVGGTGTTRRFDIAYETTSGDVMVLYSGNVATSNELRYRTKLGSAGCGGGNWSGEVNLDPVRTSGTVQWVKFASDRRSSSNLLAATWADSNRDLSAMFWSGSSWSNEPATALETSLEVASAAQDVDSFDLEYESVSGDLLVAWGNSAGNNGTNGVRYRTCTGGVAACTWSATLTPPTFADDATSLDLAANPDTDELAFASVGNAGNDLQVGYWSGSAWTNTANLDTSCTTPVAGMKKVAVGWLVLGGVSRSIITYDDQGGGWVNWVVGNAGTFTTQTDYVPPTTFTPNQGWYDIQTDPQNKNQLMFTLSDGANMLWAKRLTMSAGPSFAWTEADGGTSLEATLPQSITSPFSFAYYRNP